MTTHNKNVQGRDEHRCSNPFRKQVSLVPSTEGMWTMAAIMLAREGTRVEATEGRPRASLAGSDRDQSRGRM